MFKCVFPVLFAAAAATASAQPEGRLAPVYDPQGRLIPYDGKPEPRVETPPSASSAKAGPKAGKKKSAQRKAAQAAINLRSHIEASKAEVHKITLHMIYEARQRGLVGAAG